MNKFILFLFLTVLMACGTSDRSTDKLVNSDETAPESTVDSVPWWADATIYEVNIRNYTPEGTFNAFTKHLDRLDSLGVEILWLMPIHNIGEKNRKGSLGSYYSVQDYRSVNTEFGSKADFQALVNAAHARGMKVILDWVANHTAWDHPWVVAHSDWYSASAGGERPTVPFDENDVPTDWTDVADLDYDNEDMRAAMIADMAYWVKDLKVDGFRCDVAHWVPVDFWKEAIAELSLVQPELFMLAESNYPPNVTEAGFLMDYGWDMHHRMNQVAQHKEDVSSICRRVDSIDLLYNDDGFKMNFITNHDENSWNGTVEERMGQAGDAMAVLAFTLPGMPLIYSGQEAGLDVRLAFFEKDEINWTNADKSEFYQKLTQLKASHKALWNGEYGEKMDVEKCEDGLMAYSRGNGTNQVWVFLNFSDGEYSVDLPDGFSFNSEYMADGDVRKTDKSYVLPPNAYLVLTSSGK